MPPRLDPVGRFRAIEWIDRTGSTNQDLVARVRSGERQPQVLIAEEQTAGRGRRDRRWEMPPGGGLLLSVFVPWTGSAATVPMAVAVAAVEAIGSDRPVRIKWPNDLVAPDDRKVGGMLSEIVTSDGETIGVVAGIGMNVTWPEGSGAGPPHAGSLSQLAPDPVDRPALARRLLERLDRLLDELETDGPETVLDRYRERTATVGRRVRIETEAGWFEGIAVRIGADGSLVVRTTDGDRTVTAADVVHLRPGPSSDA